jgi:hypothetical protein
VATSGLWRAWNETFARPQSLRYKPGDCTCLVGSPVGKARANDRSLTWPTKHAPDLPKVHGSFAAGGLDKAAPTLLIPGVDREGFGPQCPHGIESLFDPIQVSIASLNSIRAGYCTRQSWPQDGPFVGQGFPLPGEIGDSHKNVIGMSPFPRHDPLSTQPTKHLEPLALLPASRSAGWVRPSWPPPREAVLSRAG